MGPPLRVVDDILKHGHATGCREVERESGVRALWWCAKAYSEYPSVASSKVPYETSNHRLRVAFRVCMGSNWCRKAAFDAFCARDSKNHPVPTRFSSLYLVFIY